MVGLSRRGSTGGTVNLNLVVRCEGKKENFGGARCGSRGVRGKTAMRERTVALDEEMKGQLLRNKC